MSKLLIALFLALLASTPVRAEGVPSPIPSTAIIVTPFHKAFVVRGDDGMDHVEYNLLVVNVFTAPVAVTLVEVLDPAGTVVDTFSGERLAAAMQTMLEQKPGATVGSPGALALEMDVILKPGVAVPDRLTHRISYSFAPDSVFASIVGTRQIDGPEVDVDRTPAIAILPPLRGPGWAAINGCCVPNIHRSVRIGAGTRIAAPETFAIDWIKIENGKFFTGDGKTNADYPYFGADIISVADSEVIAVRDGMEESNPFLTPTTVKAPGDYGGNYVLARIAPDVYAFYAHLQPGSLTVKVGDKVKGGAVLARLGNTGNSTAPHLHFGLIDRPDFLTGESLPFVFPRFEVTGKITGGDPSGFQITPEQRTVTSAYPLVSGIVTYP